VCEWSTHLHASSRGMPSQFIHQRGTSTLFTSTSHAFTRTSSSDGRGFRDATTHTALCRT
jgi:hypothetical protein